MLRRWCMGTGCTKTLALFALTVERMPLQKAITDKYARTIVHVAAQEWSVKKMDDYTERSKAFLDEYIQRGEVLKIIDELVFPICVFNEYNIGKHNGWIEGRGDAALAIITTPPADVVEVVRCKDCAWYSPLAFKPSIGDCRYWLYEERIDSLPVYEDDYCSYGERKDDENAERR